MTPRLKLIRCDEIADEIERRKAMLEFRTAHEMEILDAVLDVTHAAPASKADAIRRVRDLLKPLLDKEYGPL